MAMMKERGKILLKGEIAQGRSQRGNVWQRQQVVFEVAYGNSVRRVAAQASTDMVVELADYKVGDRVEFGYVTSAREWNDKWYAQCDLLSISKIEGKPSEQAPASAPESAPAKEEGSDDLPF